MPRRSSPGTLIPQYAAEPDLAACARALLAVLAWEPQDLPAPPAPPAAGAPPSRRTGQAEDPRTTASESEEVYAVTHP